MFTDKAVLKEKFICNCTCKKKKILKSVPKLPSQETRQRRENQTESKQRK